MISEKSPTRKSLCLVICYMGRLPAYIDCVFRSCECNEDIDWLIFTDDQTARRTPANVRIMPATFDGLREQFSRMLGMEVCIPNSYQLCKFKPAYGYLFEDVLKGYDFWGHTDLDVIYGDLRKFIREDILAAYNKVLCRAHLSLYRNVPEVNKYFMLEAPKVVRYDVAFRDPENRQFDEWRGICPLLRYHNVPQYHEEFIVDVVPPTRWKYTRFEGTSIRNYPYQVFYWYQGKVFQAYLNSDEGTVDQEFAYIHFQRRPLPAPSFDPYEADGFLITPGGFEPYRRENLTKEDYLRYNRERTRPARELMEKARRSLRRRLGLRGSR